MSTRKAMPILLCLAVLLSSCSKGDNGVNNPPSNLPAISVQNATVKRENEAATARFYVDLSAKSDQQVSVKYATESGTAKSDEDFQSTSGTLTFKPGEKELSVDVAIPIDSLRQSSQTFYMTLSDPQNAKIETGKATGTIINNGTYLPTDTAGYDTPKSYPGYNLVWNDEFNDSQLNKNDWNYETGGGGWGNNELENYTSRPQNSFLSSGNLIIEARKEDYEGNHYTSARITTKGKQEFTYGRIDIRAKLPVDKGMWPALWMLGDNISSVGWPQCGEIDIMELVGQNPQQVVGSLHWKKANGSEGTFNNAHSLSSGDFSQKFHVFSLIWSRDSLKVAVDDIPYTKASRQDLSDGTYPFDNPFFLIFNVAVGGNWPGPPDANTSFPQRMFVDYVRVFQKK
ncbi:MAG TPA: family 16 glycosylhydrolase [Balneolaceae bacterium]|nr:family 16 glycosylhydrolase [Balneolaceae bacterium]